MGGESTLCRSWCSLIEEYSCPPVRPWCFFDIARALVRKIRPVVLPPSSPPGAGAALAGGGAGAGAARAAGAVGHGFLGGAGAHFVEIGFAGPSRAAFGRRLRVTGPTRRAARGTLP